MITGDVAGVGAAGQRAGRPLPSGVEPAMSSILRQALRMSTVRSWSPTGSFICPFASPESPFSSFRSSRRLVRRAGQVGGQADGQVGTRFGVPAKLVAKFPAKFVTKVGVVQ
jgi:hypothetical protein